MEMFFKIIIYIVQVIKRDKDWVSFDKIILDHINFHMIITFPVKIAKKCELKKMKNRIKALFKRRNFFIIIIYLSPRILLFIIKFIRG